MFYLTILYLADFIRISSTCTYRGTSIHIDNTKHALFYMESDIC